MKATMIAALALFLSFAAHAADKKDAAAAMDPKMADMMKKMEAAGTPGEPHKRLAELVGTWKTSSQMWHAPDAPPETTKGTAKFKMILGGRFLQQEFKGKAMGKSFEGIGTVGYDNVKAKYESTWMDTMSTGLMRSEGDYNVETKTLTDKGMYSCPISKGKQQEVRTEWNMGDKKKMVFSMFGKGPDGKGPEFKMMEITYTR